MSSYPHPENFRSLFLEVQRNLNLIRVLDEKADNLKKYIFNQTSELLMSPSVSKDRISAVRKYFDKAIQYDEDKEQIATQTHKLLNNRIAQIDTHISRLEAKLKNMNLQKSETFETEELNAFDKLTYCLCNGIYHGEMIGCDNFGCPIQWFHLDCINLTAIHKPKDKWYCDLCS